MTEFSTKKVTAKLFLLLVFSDVLETVTHVCFKKSVSAEMAFTFSNAGAFFSFLHGVMLSPFLWLGLASVLITFIIWTLILSRIDLSVAVPIASFSYILIPVVSVIFLHERISLIRWLGIACILSGVILVSMSSGSKERIPGE